MDSLRLYAHYTWISLRGQMEYRASFLFQAAGLFLITSMEFLAIVMLFHRFHHIGTWTLHEVALLYGMISVSLAMADATATGFDQFHMLIRRGDFDRVLLRPRSTGLQLASQALSMRQAGRIAQGLVVLVWAVIVLDVEWTSAKAALLAAAIIAGAAIFYGIFIIQATLTFWTIQGLEIVNAASYGGGELGRYPMFIYRPPLRWIFTVFIPLACTTYYPALAILDRADILGAPVWVQWCAPLAGPVFLAATLAAWRYGVRHYQSTGS